MPEVELAEFSFQVIPLEQFGIVNVEESPGRLVTYVTLIVCDPKESGGENGGENVCGLLGTLVPLDGQCVAEDDDPSK
jgi:hypothetical protein